MTAYRRPSARWRSPYVVPLYAVVMAFLLAIGVSALGNPSTALEVVGPSPPQTAHTTAAAAPAAPFTAATDGKSVFSVTAEDPALREPVLWTVMGRVEGQPDTFAPLRPSASLPLNSEHPLEESLVDRLLCVTVPEGWTVSVPPGLADLAGAATGVVAERTACQGGWSDVRAVPATLTFLAGERG